MMRIIYILIGFLFPLLLFSQRTIPWTERQAERWKKQQGWLVGSNFIPSTSINQFEMWQKESFDTATINRELGWAQNLGFNCMRVFLHHAVWQKTPGKFKNRIEQYLEIATRHKIKTLFVFFDDCWNDHYQLGKQPSPKIGVHNSGWVRDPGSLLYKEPKLIDTLYAYVTDILNTFKYDRRIVGWDLYNEAGNSGNGIQSLSLLKKVFAWGRMVNPSQPLTSGLWDESLTEINDYLLKNSDVITYHDYQSLEKHTITADSLLRFHKPLICTEYMARTHSSTFATILPMLKSKQIGAINWGFVAGKTNTIYAWDKPMPGGQEPKVWFHDIFRKNGEPFNKQETDFITNECEAKP